MKLNKERAIGLLGTCCGGLQIGVTPNKARIHQAWVRYALMIAVLLILMFVVVVVTWPSIINSVLEKALLRQFSPSPWPVAPAPAAVAGCYELTYGAWKPNEDLGLDSRFIKTPHKIELTLEPYDREAGWYVMRPAAGEGASIHQLSSWRITPDRTLLLRWSTGSSGVTAELGTNGRILQGRARTCWDFPRILQMASIQARRTICSEGGQR